MCRHEVWSLDVNPTETRLVTGSNDSLDLQNWAAGLTVGYEL